MNQPSIQILNSRCSQLCSAGKVQEALVVAKAAVGLVEANRLIPKEDAIVSRANLAQVFQTTGDAVGAENEYLRCLKLAEETQPAAHPMIVTILTNIGQFYQVLGHHARAEFHYQRALAATARAGKNGEKLLAFIYKGLADVNYSKGNLGQAEAMGKKALEIVRTTSGADHPDTAICLSSLALIHQGKGELATAEQLHGEALAILEVKSGPEHRDTAACLNNLGLLYRLMGKSKLSQEFSSRALKIRTKVLPEGHPDTATTRSNLAILYFDMGDYRQALSLGSQALKVLEGLPGPESPCLAAVLHTLACVHQDLGEFAIAIPLYTRALASLRRTHPEHHPFVAQCLNSLAVLHERMGDYDRARQYYGEALRTLGNLQAPDLRNQAISLNLLAHWHQTQGHYSQAESLYKQSVPLFQTTWGPEHPNTLNGLGNLATLYLTLGEYARAEALWSAILKSQQANLPSDHPALATAHNNLGLLYRLIGDFAKAQHHYERAMAARGKSLPVEHHEMAICQMHLASIHEARGGFEKAEVLFLKALAITEKGLPPDHPQKGYLFSHLANLYLAMKDYGRAESLLTLAALTFEKKFDAAHPDVMMIHHQMAGVCWVAGKLTHAEAMYEEVLSNLESKLGRTHPLVTICLENLARLTLDLGKRTQALEWSEKRTAALIANMGAVFSFASEGQRLSFAGMIDAYGLIPTLGSAQQIAGIVLRTKAIVLDSMIEDKLVARTASEPEIRDVVDQLKAANRRLMEFALGPPGGGVPVARAKWQEQWEQARQSVDEMQKKLARYVSSFGRGRRSLHVSLAQVQAALPHDTVLVEYVRYSHHPGKLPPETCYGALVIPPAGLTLNGKQAGEPAWLRLGPAERIDANLTHYRFLMREGAGEESILQELRAQLFAPVAATLPAQVRSLIICPDGELHFLSFATLLTPGGVFLGEDYAFYYVASGRDLLWEKGRGSTSRQCVVFANPDFEAALQGGARSAASQGWPALDQGGFRSFPLPPLPGTESEAGMLEKLCREWRLDYRPYLRANASEANIYRIRSPYILHLATHGFCLPLPAQSGVQYRPLNPQTLQEGNSAGVAMRHPMHRSGLALARAANTFAAWARGETPPTESDGVLSAEEAAGLELSDTWLVVLSACDTGSGEALVGEGVLGLRRGFVTAGARNLLLSLAPIRDHETSLIMEEFYREALKTGKAPQALARVQRDWLARLRKKRSTIEAAQLAGQFILSFQGRL